MKYQLRALWLILILASVNVFAQSNKEFFASGAGNFSIDLPPKSSSVKNTSFNDEVISAEGQHFIWDLKPDNFYQVQYVSVFSSGKTLTAKEKTYLVKSLRDGLQAMAVQRNYAFSEKPFSFQGNVGVEIEMVMDRNILTVTRCFVFNKKSYVVSAMIYNAEDKPKALKVLDSFKILDPQTRLAKLVEENTPDPLPQTPVAAKPKSDAANRNLKGKVKSIVVEDLVDGKRERSSEEYYDENGNLIKAVDYQEGYPTSVTVWGYIDGNRVSLSDTIEYPEGELPPPRALTITMRAEDNALDTNAPRDTRYDMKHSYKYDEQNRLIEEAHYQNNGEVWNRTIYKYKGNQIEELDYDQRGQNISQTFKFLDKDGNVIEQHLMNAEGKIGDDDIFKYQFDKQGNIIVENAFAKKKIKGKIVLRPLWTIYRKINYYN